MNSPSYIKNTPNIYRAWAMPNKNTFSIKPIREMIDYWIRFKNEGKIIDPFSNGNNIADITNDIDECFRVLENV